MNQSGKDVYDYVIIGGGSAGSVVASRLSEDPDRSVLLLEAGGPERSLYIAMPLAYRLLRTKGLFDWGYESAPEPFADDRVVPAPRGRVLGGCSSVNGLMYSRGHPADYDQWAQMGASGWSFDDVLPYFRKSERNWRGETDRHGGSGPLGVARADFSDPLTAALHDTARSKGHRVVDDFEADGPDGFALPDLTVDRGRRASASRAFLGQAKGRSNLSIRTGAQATRVLIEGGRAVGVEYIRAGRRQTVLAAREVVLCGGAFASPHLLMLSGIGPAEELRRHGITVQADLAGVGRNLQDHVVTPMMFAAKKPFAFGRRLRADRIAMAGLTWLLTGRGPAATVPLTSIAYHRSRPDLERPDLENIFVPSGMSAHVWFPGWRRPAPDVLTSINVVLRPASRGFVTLASSDPLAAPHIQYNLLADPQDRERLKYSVAWTRDLLSTGPASAFVGEELFPGPGVSESAALEAYARKTVATAHHPAGTCAIGPVVDAALRVHGVEGLRVADASVMPELIGGHTNAVAIMIGEKAADLLMVAS
ncbi:glucose-methanol-choline oxidoreductase [Sphingopyxis sp. Root1497]|uniref:GMC family oxidoreductase n=1 Tax=Sphingopyxis sp. Root1497 TaxID=1736474 RepID=UPI0006F3022E|nr:GMC family oxidoreductase N-terminal domain-containing protein [Sphingopyxis sp. Root1497]KQZ61040.1 glucose-methanol-choline oxidoreductase [Sphingopyxis sp. Root1497]